MFTGDEIHSLHVRQTIFGSALRTTLMPDQATSIDHSLPCIPGPEHAAHQISCSETSQGTARLNSFVHELVANRAAETPDAPALIAGAEIISYRELDARANQIANYLKRLGVTPNAPDNIVGLCLDRSVDAVVFALGILKAGAAYLPLDPAYPAERLRFMLNDARPRVLITQQEIAEKLPLGPWSTIAIDRGGAEIFLQPADLAGPVITGEHLAYVIYTSGSTGQPKGVEIT